MGPELNGIGHNTAGHDLTDAAGHVVGDEVCDHTVFHMLRQRDMDIEEGAGIDGQIPDAKLRDLLHHHIQHEVAVAQVMVEGHGHAVLQTGKTNGLLNGRNNFTHSISLLIPRASAAAMVRSALVTMGASIILP